MESTCMARICASAARILLSMPKELAMARNFCGSTASPSKRVSLNHMSSVLRKLQLSSRHELTRWASDRRLL